MVKKLFSISDEVVSRLNQEKNQSAFVDSLLHVYYGLSPDDPARQELAMDIAAFMAMDKDELADPLLPTHPPTPVPDTVMDSPNPPEPPLVETPAPLDETPMVPALAQATSDSSESPQRQPCEHGVIPPAVCIDCI